jgi:hypothetical protein
MQLRGNDPASKDAAAMLAQAPGSAVAGLLAAERVMVAKQLAQHYCTNGAATGAVHDAKVTGRCSLWPRSESLLMFVLLNVT